jgi:hypothetical protein
MVPQFILVYSNTTGINYQATTQTMPTNKGRVCYQILWDYTKIVQQAFCEPDL